jgi:hypothetical protein
MSHVPEKLYCKSADKNLLQFYSHLMQNVIMLVVLNLVNLGVNCIT